MPNLAIANFTSTVKQNCAWAQSVHFTNADGSDFDLTPFSSLTFQVRASAGYTDTPLANGTVTVTSAVGGVAVVGLSAQVTGELPATGRTFEQTTPTWAEIDGVLTADPDNPICLAQALLQVVPGGNARQTTGSAPTVPLATINLVVGAVSAAAARQMLGVNDSGGKIPVAQIPLATASSPGAMSAAQVEQVATAYAATAAPFVGPVNLIIDADWGQDGDDIGALAVAHRLCDLGEARIIAMANSFSQADGARGIAAINAFYGRPDIPVGLGGAVAGDDNYRTVSAALPNSLAGVTPPTAVSVYRKALAGAPNGSVVWFVQGPMTILAAMVASAADEISPMTGVELMAAKLSKLVILGGVFPDGGAEYDFYSDVAATQVINSLPTLLPSVPVFFSGYHFGLSVLTNSGQPAWSAVKIMYGAFFATFGGTSRPSWGAMGVLYCVRGLSTYFTLSAAGTCTVDGSGNNTWTAGASGPHRYLIQAASNAEMQTTIQTLQDALPTSTATAVDYTANGARFRQTLNIDAPSACQLNLWTGGVYRGSVGRDGGGTICSGAPSNATSVRGAAGVVLGDTAGAFFVGNSLFKFLLARVPTYANNAAAIAGGLTAGNVYRTGGDPDTLCIVH